MIKTAAWFSLYIGLAGSSFAAHIPPQHFIENVPFTSQLPNFCGPCESERRKSSSILAIPLRPFMKVITETVSKGLLGVQSN